MLQGNFGRGIAPGRSIRKDAKARAALDLTSGAPKSITLQALIGGDEPKYSFATSASELSQCQQSFR